MFQPERVRHEGDRADHRLVHVVWEVTLACDLKCLHCGSRAGHRRQNELTTQEALATVDQIAALGCRELTLIGGEAYMRRDLAQIIARAKSHGMYCAIQTGGRTLRDDKLRAYIAAGLDGIGVSIDGLALTHDRLRGVPGSYLAATGLLDRARDAGLNVSVNSQICAATKHELDDLFDVLVAAGVRQWQLQLTVAMGNAVDHADLIVQPHEIRDIYEQVLELYFRGLKRDLLVIPGNNVGYFGPMERALRAVVGAHQHWGGCEAGATVMGLESDGTIKGCPSLETGQFSLGNVRDAGAARHWQTADKKTKAARKYKAEGFCGSCYYESVCQAGCTWTSQSLLGHSGDNPYCYYRAKTLAGKGLRECVEKLEEAPDRPFAVGLFRLSAETEEGRRLSQADYASQVRDPRARPAPPEGTALVPCDDCGCFLFEDESACPHCASAAPLASRGPGLHAAL